MATDSGFDRRALLGLGAAAAVATPAVARAQDPSVVQLGDLWPGPPPGGERVTVEEQVVLRTPGGDPNDTAFVHVRKPWLMMRRPERPNGAAVLMIPGGGYQRVAVGKAGGGIDAWFARQGITAFVMDYRLPADGWAAGPDVALQDAQRAIRLIRARAPEFGLDPARVAVAGFSAGGHVAARLATRFATDSYAPLDAADRLPTRPLAAALFYPVITLTAPYAHGGSLKNLLGPAPTDAARRAISAEQDIPADAPPTFIAAAADDKVVPMENSLLMFQALRAKGIASELHVFEAGGHGLGVSGQAGPMPSAELLSLFLKRHGLFA
ncbi:alpha/beta hydrolase [Caulobacter sp. LARHSG274]